ncbi:MAG: 4a-hydroxytetrahydrobiopterin dehydratase [Cyanobacteria bacterium P01_H01_bin.15]
MANQQTLLTPLEIEEQLTELPKWDYQNTELTRTFQFANFIESIAFVEQLVLPAEELGHHPDIDIRYNQVTIRLTTHDIGGIGPLDLSLAKTINEIYGEQANTTD